MKTLLIALLVQSISAATASPWLRSDQSMPVPLRISMENPSAVTPIPPKLKKDYDKLWSQFQSVRDDKKLANELEKFLKKNKNFDPALTIRAYLDLQAGREASAVQKFQEILASYPNHRIAQFYLAEIMFARGDYGRANLFYSQLLANDKSRVDLELKRQKALLLATENLLQSAARAERENRFTTAEELYREALRIVPKEPMLHLRLADLLDKSKKPEEAAAERKIAAALMPPSPSKTSASDETSVSEKVSELEDLGRWGTQIDLFREIKSASAVTREQLAVVIVRYFPQLTEIRQSPKIMTDVADSWARPEIQTVAGLGLIDPLPNRTFEPTAPITRGDFANAMGRLSRVLRLSPPTAAPASLTDLAPTNARYDEIQLVLGYGLLTLEDSGSFNAGGSVSGKEAVTAADSLTRSFQQLPR